MTKSFIFQCRRKNNSLIEEIKELKEYVLEVSTKILEKNHQIISSTLKIGTILIIKSIKNSLNGKG